MAAALGLAAQKARGAEAGSRRTATKQAMAVEHKRAESYRSPAADRENKRGVRSNEYGCQSGQRQGRSFSRSRASTRRTAEQRPDVAEENVRKLSSP